MTRLLRRLWYLLRPDRHERELDDELRFHLEMERRELVSRGLDPDAATLAARRAMGNLPLTRNQVRDVWIAPWLQDVLQDVRYGLRTLRRHPGFAAVAIATLAIGIGASTATFSIADAVLMQPLPVQEQRNLSVLWGVDPAVGAGRVPVPYGAFRGFVDASPKTLSAIAGVDYHGAGRLPVREQGEGVNLRVALVTGNLFNVLGVTPLLGRLAPGATVDQSAARTHELPPEQRRGASHAAAGMTASAETFDDDLLGDVRPVILLLLLASGAGQPWKPRAADHHAGQQCRAGFIERAHEPQAVRAASLDRGPIRRVNPAELPRCRRFPEIGVVTLRARRQSANPMT